MIFSRFESIGTYLPKTVIATRELIGRMDYPPQFDLENITGIHNRRVHDKSECSFEDSFALAMRAAQSCLERSRYRAEDLDVVISASISRYKDGYRMHFEPAFSLLLKQNLGALGAIHFDVSNACAGMMTGVYILDRMIKAGVVKNGLVVSGECITTISDTAVKEIREAWDPQFGSLTVGDSAAAVIIDRSETDDDKIHYIEMLTCAEYARLCVGMPSDRNSGLALYTNNHEMHKEERLQLWPRYQSDFLARLGSTFADEKYDYIVHHQVGTRAVQNFSRCGEAIFGDKMPPSLLCVEEYGNTATTSHFLVLHDHLQRKKGRFAEKFLFVPAASGLVTGCVSATIKALEV